MKHASLDFIVAWVMYMGGIALALVLMAGDSTVFVPYLPTFFLLSAIYWKLSEIASRP